jgi:HlyD family secretion protein
MTDNNKLSPEKLKQLQQLQQMMMQQQKSATQQPLAPGLGARKAPSKFTPKGMFIAILQTMQNSVKFIDQFIEFIVKKDGDKTNDVIKSARSPIIFGIFVLIFFVFVGIIWSATAPLDSAAVAIGKVISNTNKKNINHPEGGIIKKIYVKVGDHVKKGEKLIEFDNTRIKSEYENYLNQYRSHSASESRLLAEINNEQKIDYPIFLLKDKALPEVARIIETQNNLFHSKNELQLAEQDSLKQRIKQSRKQIEGYNAKKVALQKTLEVTQDRLDANRKLEAQGYAHKATILELEAKEANAQSELAMADTEISKSEQEITKTEIDLINLESKNSTNSLVELKDTQIRLADSRERFFSWKDSLNRVAIVSPVDGVVNNLNYHTIGSSIPGSHPIMEISTSDDTLIIEVKIPPQNIDSIRIGLESKIRFSAFKSRTTPLFNGTVISLSPDIIIDQGQQMDPKLAGGYYLARIELDMQKFNDLATPRNLKLQPGMQAEVQIVTGTRTLLQYLLDPVIDAMFKGFKEK